jgi:hypothetical protein
VFSLDRQLGYHALVIIREEHVMPPRGVQKDDRHIRFSFAPMRPDMDAANLST